MESEFITSISTRSENKIVNLSSSFLFLKKEEKKKRKREKLQYVCLE